MKSSLARRLLDIDANYSRRLMIADQRGNLRNLAIIFAHSGDSWFWLLALGVVWLFAEGDWRALALTMVFGIFLTAGVVFLIKFTIRRPRPAGEWGAIYRRTDPHSFPSGHAARATMLVVLAVGLGPFPFGLLLTVWALLVILARVAMGVHYLSDVIAGAALGAATGLITLALNPLIQQVPALFGLG